MLPSGFEPTTTQVDRILNSSSRQQQMRMNHPTATQKLRASGTISRNSSITHSTTSHSHTSHSHASNSLKDSNAVNHRILTTGEYSDLRLVCHGREYHVHKAIVCPQVSFLEGACREGFREAATGIVDLSNLCESSELLQKAINFLYVHEVPVSTANSPDHSEASKTYVSLYILSDKLGIPSLREYCMGRVKAYASMLPHKTVYEMTEMVYAQTMPSDEFRSILIKQVCQRAQRLFENDDVRGTEEFRNFCSISEEIWFDVIKFSLTFGGGMNSLNRGNQSFSVVI